MQGRKKGWRNLEERNNPWGTITVVRSVSPCLNADAFSPRERRSLPELMERAIKKRGRQKELENESGRSRLPSTLGRTGG